MFSASTTPSLYTENENSGKGIGKVLSPSAPKGAPPPDNIVCPLSVESTQEISVT